MSYTYGYHYQAQGGGGVLNLDTNINVSAKFGLIWDCVPNENGGIYPVYGTNTHIAVVDNLNVVQFRVGSNYYNVPLVTNIPDNQPCRIKMVYDPADVGNEFKVWLDLDLNGFVFEGSSSPPSAFVFRGFFSSNTESLNSRLQIYDGDPDAGATLLHDFNANYVRNADDTAFVTRNDPSAEVGSNSIVYDVVGGRKANASNDSGFSQIAGILEVNGSSTSSDVTFGEKILVKVNPGFVPTAGSLSNGDKTHNILNVTAEPAADVYSFQIDLPEPYETLAGCPDLGAVTLTMTDGAASPTFGLNLVAPAALTTLTFGTPVELDETSLFHDWVQPAAPGNVMMWEDLSNFTLTQNAIWNPVTPPTWLQTAYLFDDDGLKAFVIADDGATGEAPPNQSPVAEAGSNVTVNGNVVVTLDATGSTDPDVDDILSFTWSQVSGTVVTLSDVNAAQPTFTTPNDYAGDVLVFEVSVFDGELTATDQVTVNVNPRPDTVLDIAELPDGNYDVTLMTVSRPVTTVLDNAALAFVNGQSAIQLPSVAAGEVIKGILLDAQDPPNGAGIHIEVT